MSRALLDVNVLLALLDSDHVDHARAWAWFDESIQHGWASCPVTENGFIRIVSQPRYPSPVAPAVAMDLLSGARASEQHEFWPCDVSLLDPGRVDRTRVHGSRAVTDAYLLALAVAHGGHLVTFDRGVPVSAVHGAQPDHVTVL